VLRVDRHAALADTAKDRRVLNEIAIDAMRRFGVKLHAYCLMDNHLRALIQIHDRRLAKTLRHVATRYSRYRRRTLHIAEHLFERPYKAQRIESDIDFLNLLRCIHLNPVIANKVVAPGDYPWSSHRAYVGYKSNALINTEFGLSLLASDAIQARAAYKQFIEEEMPGSAPPTEIAVKSHSVSSRTTADQLLGVAASDETPSPTSSPRSEPTRTSARTSARLDQIRARKNSRRFLSFY